MTYDINMEINLRALSEFFAVVCVLIAIRLVAHYYKTHKVIHSKYMLITWTCIMIEEFFYGLAWMNGNDRNLLDIGNVFAIIMVIAFFLLMESISHDKFDFTKMLIYFVILMGYVASGDRTYMYVSMVYISGIWVYFHVKMYTLAPKVMQKGAILSILGSLVMAIGNCYFLFDFGDYNGFLIGLGILVLTLGYHFAPNLAYLIPNKVYKLTIVHLNNGIPLFSHNWNFVRAQIDDVLFSGMLSGICMLVKETVDKGNLREITLDNANLIVHRDLKYPVAFILVTEKSTVALRSALDEFAKRFVSMFADQLIDIYEVNRFRVAATLVEQCFSFIPIGSVTPNPDAGQSLSSPSSSEFLPPNSSSK